MNTINQQSMLLKSCSNLIKLLTIQMNEVKENYFCDEFTQYADTMNSLEYSLTQLKRMKRDIKLISEQYQQSV